jgi:hypothetical protein
MSLFFGYCAHPVDEVERLLEVGELELSVDVMFVRDRPFWDALVYLLEFFS